MEAGRLSAPARIIAQIGAVYGQNALAHAALAAAIRTGSFMP